MRRRDWLLAAGASGLLLAACRGRAGEIRGDIEALAHHLVSLQGSPVVLFLWAPWSRAAVELEPTMVELEREYRPFGVEFLAIVLGPGARPDHLQIPRFRLEGDALTAFERFGVRDAPAILTLTRQGQLEHRIEPHGADGRIDAGDIVDAIESVALAR